MYEFPFEEIINQHELKFIWNFEQIFLNIPFIVEGVNRKFLSWGTSFIHALKVS